MVVKEIVSLTPEILNKEKKETFYFNVLKEIHPDLFLVKIVDVKAKKDFEIQGNNTNYENKEVVVLGFKVAVLHYSLWINQNV